MGAVAYNVAGAAEATALPEHSIKLAIRDRRLIARELDNRIIVLTTDLQAWLETLPTL